MRLSDQLSASHVAMVPLSNYQQALDAVKMLETKVAQLSQQVERKDAEIAQLSRAVDASSVQDAKAKTEANRAAREAKAES